MLALIDPAEFAGKGSIDSVGYVRVYYPSHPRAWSGGYVFLHTIVAEWEIGRYLLPDEEVHHEDECRSNNEPSNLTVKRSHWEHSREHSHWVCRFCREPLSRDDPAAYFNEKGQSSYHRPCYNKYRKARYEGKWYPHQLEGVAGLLRQEPSDSINE